MHCILIGVTPLSGIDSEDAASALWNTLTQQVETVDDFTVNWVAASTSYDEDVGKTAQLFCATTDASVDDVVEETSRAVSVALGDDCHNCELWASAPDILPLRPSAGYDNNLLIQHDGRNNEVPGKIYCEGWAASTMKEWGMFVQTALIDASEVRQLRICINEEIATIEKLIQLHRPDITIGKDIMSFAEIASRGNERFDLLIRPRSKAYDFVEHTILGRIAPTIERILDGRVNEDVDFDISVVYSKPGAPHQGWHADGDHQRGANDAGWEADGWKNRLAEPYAMCLFIPLIDLNDDTGYTQFWPASHRYRGLMGFGPVSEITGATWNGKCEAGDAIWYDYRLMHRGMGNTSEVVRPVLQVLFKKKWYVEERNYGTESLRQR